MANSESFTEDWAEQWFEAEGWKAEAKGGDTTALAGRIRKEIESLLQQAASDGTANDAGEAAWSAVTEATAAVRKVLDTPLKAEALAEVAKLAALRIALANAGQAAEQNRKARKLAEDAASGRVALGEVKDPPDLDSDVARKKQIDEARKAIADALVPPLDAQKVADALAKIAGFKELCDKVGQAIREEIARKKLEAEAKQGAAALAEVKDPPDLDTDAARKKQVDEARKLIADAFVPPLDAQKVADALAKIAGFKELCTKVGDAIRAEIARKKLEADAKQGLTALAEVKDPDGLATDAALKKKIDDARKAIADDLAAPLNSDKVAAAVLKIPEFKKQCEAATKTLAKAKVKSKFVDVKVGDQPLEEGLFDAMFEVFGGNELDTLVTDFGGAAGLAAACSGFQAPAGALKQLKALTDNGLGGGKGLKALLETGCAGDPKRLRAFSDQFPAEGDQKALATLLKDGLDGKPETLAHLLATGCDGKAETFKALAGAFKDAPEQAKLKALLKDGGFGDKPASFAHVFKTGCGGNADTLKGLHTQFKDSLPKLKSMITNGGMAEKPETFGKVMSTALGSDPANVKKFQQAFDGATDVAKLKDIIGALESNDAGVEGDPGNALKTLLDAKHLNTTDYNKLKTKYYATIKAQAGADAAKLKQLLRAAPTFTKTAMSGAPETLPQPDNLATHGQKTSRMKHFLDRHTRAHYGGANDVNNSFFPEGTSEAEVAGMLKEALNTMAADAPRLRNSGGGSLKYVPLKSAGIWVQIGVKPVKNATSPNIPTDVGPIPPPPPQYKYVDQFFPISDDNVKAFYTADNPPGSKAWYENIIKPENGWPNTPKKIETFSRQEMVAMLNAAKP